MADADLTWDLPALEQALGKVAERVVPDITDRILDRARGYAPVVTGAYREGLESTVSGSGMDTVGRVGATDWSSHWVEWGSINNPTYAPLRNAVESLGLRLQ